FIRMVEVEVVVNLPVAAHIDSPATCDEQVPGEQLVDALEQRLAVQAELEGEVILEAGQVGLDVLDERQQRLDLGGEVKAVSDGSVVERLDAKAVAGDEQALAWLVP